MSPAIKYTHKIVDIHLDDGHAYRTNWIGVEVKIVDDTRDRGGGYISGTLRGRFPDKALALKTDPSKPKVNNMYFYKVKLEEL